MYSKKPRFSTSVTLNFLLAESARAHLRPDKRARKSTARHRTRNRTRKGAAHDHNAQPRLGIGLVSSQTRPQAEQRQQNQVQQHAFNTFRAVLSAPRASKQRKAVREKVVTAQADLRRFELSHVRHDAR